jgi:signal peptidase
MVNKKKQLIFRLILFVIISAILGVGIYTMNAKMLMNDMMPMPLGVGMGVVVSGSMEPELSIDDVIFVVKDKDIELDDIVVYQSKGILVVHEVIKIDGDQITTQGTANNTPDDPIDISSVKGRVAFSISGIGKIISFIKTPFVSIAILLLAVFLLYKSYAAEKNQKDEKDERIEEIRKEIMRMKEERNK